MKNIFTYLYTCTWEKCAIRRDISNRGSGRSLWIALLLALSGVLFAIGCADSPIDQGDFTAPEPVNTLNASSSDVSSVTLNWEPSSSSDAAQIEITWVPRHGEEQPKIVPANSIGAIITGLNAGTEYTFFIAVLDTAGNISNTTEMSATTAAIPVIFDSESYAFTSVVHSSGSTVGSVLATVDSEDALIQYEIVSSTDGDLFQINPANGAITVGDNDLATETLYEFSVRAQSSQGGSAQVSVTVNTAAGTVIFSNAPYIFSNIAYNAQSPVGTVSAMVDSNNATISSYQIFNNNDGIPADVLPSEDARFFAIDADGTITVGDIPLATNTSYTFSVRATSSEGTDAVVDVTIMTALAPISFTESVYAFSNIARAANTSVGTVTATVDSSSADIASYEIVASSDGANFVIDANSGDITVGSSAIAPNTTYTFMVRATSSEGTAAEVTVTASTALAAVTFPNSNAPYVFADGSHQSGSTVGIVSATVDSITATIASYAIVSGVDDGALFAIDAASGTITVGGSALTPGDAYAFSVIATSSEGATATVRVTVSSVGLDTTAPNPVTQLMANTVAGTSNIALSWKNSNSADATNVRIDWMLNGFTTVIGTNTLPVSAPGATQSTTITGLNSEIRYTFSVVVLDNAVDATGSTAPNTSTAESISATTLDTTPPDPVDDVEATPINSTSSVLLTWTDSASADATGDVRIEWRFDGVSEGEALGSVSVAQGVEMATITGLDSETGYIFTLQATDDAGNLSGPVQISETTLDADAPAAVTNFVAENTGTDGTQVALSWTNSVSDDVEFVRIEWRFGTATTGAPIDSVRFASGPTARTISDLDSETQYTFTVIVEDDAVDVNGASLRNDSEAETKTFTTPDVTEPAAVTDLRATAVEGTTNIEVEWTDSISDDATGVHIMLLTGDVLDVEGLPVLVDPGVGTVTISAAFSETEYIVRLVVVDAAGNASPGMSTVVTTADITPPAAVTAVRTNALASGTEVELTWVGSTSDDVTGQTVIWSTSAAGVDGGSGNVGKDTTTTMVGGLVFDTEYRFVIRVTDGTYTTDTSSITVHTEPNPVDADGDGLIDIDELIELNNMRRNLDGTSYKAAANATGALCGRAGDTVCSGYELTAELNFDADGDGRTWNQATLLLDTGDHNASYFGVTRSDAGGWQPIGDATNPFSTVFEGNGFAIRGLAVKRGKQYLGMFGRIDESATIRNVRLIDSLVDYTGSNTRIDFAGSLVGHNHQGTIIASSASGAVDGGNTTGTGSVDSVGGLVGQNSGIIIASYSTSNVTGNSHDNSVGGLVGYNDSFAGNDGIIETIIASYATGNVEGGGASFSAAGGLVGTNGGSIIASYATGDVTDSGGNNDRTGGLVGRHSGFNARITASYATGSVTGDNNNGTLVGSGSSNIIDSYGFGAAALKGDGDNGSPRPDADPYGFRSVSTPEELIATEVPDSWNEALSRTNNAWDIGDNTQAPVLRYADYDGPLGSTYGCGDESTATIVIPSRVPFGDGLVDVVCGSTPLPEQPEQGNRCPAGFVHTGTACVPPASTWTERTSSTTEHLRGIEYADNTWVAVGHDGTIRTATNPTGTWTARISSTTHDLQDIAYGDGTWITVGQRGVMRTSTDTITWTPRTSGAHSGSYHYLNAIAYGNGTWVAVGSLGEIRTATNPTGPWTARTSGTTQTLRSLAYANGTWVAGAWQGVILTSTDAITWTKRTSNTTEVVLGLEYANNTWVAAINTNAILTSADAITWKTHTISGTNGMGFDGIEYGNNTWVIGGQPLAILTSTDTTTWIERISDTNEMSEWYTDIVHAEGTWVAVGSAGSILTAP